MPHTPVANNRHCPTNGIAGNASAGRAVCMIPYAVPATPDMEAVQSNTPTQFFVNQEETSFHACAVQKVMSFHACDVQAVTSSHACEVQAVISRHV